MKSAYQLLHSMDPTVIVCLTENANHHTLYKTSYCTRSNIYIYIYINMKHFVPQLIKIGNYFDRKCFCLMNGCIFQRLRKKIVYATWI